LTALSAWNWVPTTIFRSPSSRANCSRGCGRYCGAVFAAHCPLSDRCTSAGWKSIPRRGLYALTGVQCDLTGYQFDLLLALAEKAGRVLSRDVLMDLVTGEHLEAFDRSIDVHMSRIRRQSRTIPRSRGA